MKKVSYSCNMNKLLNIYTENGKLHHGTDTKLTANRNLSYLIYYRLIKLHDDKIKIPFSSTVVTGSLQKSNHPVKVSRVI